MSEVIDDRGIRLACGSCGKVNRLAYGALDRASRCGQCKTTLASPPAPVSAPDAASFDAASRDSVLPLIVDFWAPWCGPCRMVAPELERVARDHAGEWLIVKVNTDEVQALGERYRIRSIPTLAVFHRGRELGRTAGAMPAAQIEAFVRQTIGSAATRAS